MLLDFIRWTVSPDIFSIGPLTFRWYGLLWAVGFMVGYYVVMKVYNREGIQQEQSSDILMYMLVGTIIGARLGHCFFYDFAFFYEVILIKDLFKFLGANILSAG